MSYGTRYQHAAANVHKAINATRVARTQLDELTRHQPDSGEDLARRLALTQRHLELLLDELHQANARAFGDDWRHHQAGVTR